MQQEEEALQPQQERARRIKKLKPAQLTVDDEVKDGVEDAAAAASNPGSTKNAVLTSPQDVVIECQGEKIQAHAAALRKSVYFATILDEVDLGETKTITLPDTFEPENVRAFVCALYDCLDPDDYAQVYSSLKANGIVSLAELSHYFDTPLLHAACSHALADKHKRWFPQQLLLVTQVAITNHLLLLRNVCTESIRSDIDGSGLLAHLHRGRGDLAKDSELMAELVTELHDSLIGAQYDGRCGISKALYHERRSITTSPEFYESN
jgi:hypothetical protein